MTRWVPRRFRRGCAAAAMGLALILLPVVVRAATAVEDPFLEYPSDVREQARRLIDKAVPGQEEALELQVLELRKAMFDHAILSLNVVPDLIFERARTEGWKVRSDRVLRPVTRVAPFSVGLWAWLIREDLAGFRVENLPKDVEGLEGALRQYAPGLLGCAAWLLLFFTAAAAWFTLWCSVSLLLRAQPALTFDFSRLFRKLPHPELYGFVLFLAISLAPVAAGAGLGIAAVFWLFLSAGYLRRWELLTATLAVGFLASVFLCGGALQSVTRFTGETRRGGWLGGEGYIPKAWPKASQRSAPYFAGPQWNEAVEFARARAEMQTGNLAAAEAMWTDWIRTARKPADGYNNRGIVRVWSGKPAEALADFEEAASATPEGGPAHWNAYQVYLQSFRLEDAAKIQSTAWGSLRELRLFDYRPEEMTHGEMVPSPLRLQGAWAELFRPRWGWVRDAAGSPVYRFFFRPLPGKAVPVLLFAGWLWIALWKPLSRKIWMHSTCRSCGTRTLILGGRETTDICNACRAQVGGGVRFGEEREHRILTVVMHRRYVRACSIAAPGSGGFWAGKDFGAMIFGIVLSLPLGAVTVSIGGGQLAPSLISDMLTGVVWVGAGAAILIWGWGAAWGWKAFEGLQRMYNLSRQR